MGKATPLKAPFGAKNHGKFHIEKFNMFHEDDLEKYAELRNRANDTANGIKIEMMREYTRRTTTVDGQGETQVTTSSEEIILVVQYWEKAPKRAKGDNDEELKEATKEWSTERSAS
jgi:hypothetical protein